MAKLKRAQQNDGKSDAGPRLGVLEPDFRYHAEFPLRHVPDFGVWHLTVRDAAEMTVVDMWHNGQLEFDTTAPFEFAGNPRDPELLSLLAVPIEKYEKAVIAAVDAGHIKAVRLRRDFHGVIDPLQSYIHFGELQNWLQICNYETGEVFTDYHTSESQIQDAMVKESTQQRNFARGISAGGGGRVLQGKSFEAGGPTSATAVQDAVEVAKFLIFKNQRLEAELMEAKELQLSWVDRPLHLRERRTLLVLIAAIASETNFDLKQEKVAQKLVDQCDKLNAPVGDLTIMKCLNEIPDALRAKSALVGAARLR